MGAARVPEGSVLLTGEAVDALRYAVEKAQAWRRWQGLSRSARLDVLAAVTVAGQADTAEEPVVEADYMTTEEAATVLGVSCRTARRLAPGLGGRVVGGRWFLDRLAVAEHKEGTQ